MVRTIDVVQYDSAWDEAFAHEAAALVRVFADALLGIHHIGSTSIPGLAAKPIIDTLVVLRETETIDCFSGAMEGLGYRVRGECLDAEVPGTPGRFYFSKDTGGGRAPHFAVSAVGPPGITDKLAFRGFLRLPPHPSAHDGSAQARLAPHH